MASRFDGQRWVLASGNPGKLREFSELLAPLGVRVVAQRELGLDDAAEPHPTFIENALGKARHAARGSGQTALADDSGICVPLLAGAPGVRSARYSIDEAGVVSSDGADRETPSRADIDAANNRLLIERIAGFGQPVACYYCCVVAMVRDPLDPRPLIAEGLWWGRLLATPRGLNGFGYDAHFLPEGESRTAAEMDPATKNRLSHRARALASLLAALQDSPCP